MKTNTFSIWAAFLLIISSCNSTPTQTTLKDAYADSFMIGCAVNPLHTGGRLAQANELLLKHFNAISPENCLKPEVVQPKPGVWDFRQADEFVQFGEDNDMWMLGHTLVWHNQTPEFYWVNEDGSPKSREDLIETMRQHIETVAGRYADRYEELFRIFYNRRDKIDRITLWGLTDDSSWKNGYPVPGRTNYPLLWNRDYTPHKALQSVLDLPVSNK